MGEKEKQRLSVKKKDNPGNVREERKSLFLVNYFITLGSGEGSQSFLSQLSG